MLTSGAQKRVNLRYSLTISLFLHVFIFKPSRNPFSSARILVTIKPGLPNASFFSLLSLA